jgi:hypothetical protein
VSDAGSSAEELAGVVYVQLPAGLVDDFRRLGDFRQGRDFHEREALAAAQTTIRRGGFQPPALAAPGTLGEDLHPITSAFVGLSRDSQPLYRHVTPGQLSRRLDLP